MKKKIILGLLVLSLVAGVATPVQSKTMTRDEVLAITMIAQDTEEIHNQILMTIKALEFDCTDDGKQVKIMMHYSQFEHMLEVINSDFNYGLYFERSANVNSSGWVTYRVFAITEAHKNPKLVGIYHTRLAKEDGEEVDGIVTNLPDEIEIPDDGVSNGEEPEDNNEVDVPKDVEDDNEVKPPALPETGGTNTAISIAIGLLIAAIGGVLTLGRRR